MNLTPVHRMDDLIEAARRLNIEVVLITRPWGFQSDLHQQIKNAEQLEVRVSQNHGYTQIEVPVRKHFLFSLVGNSNPGSIRYKISSFFYSLIFGERINQDFGSDIKNQFQQLNEKVRFSKDKDLIFISSPPFSLPKKLKFLENYAFRLIFEFRDLPWYPQFPFWNGNYFMHLVWRLYNLNPIKWVKNSSTITINNSIARIFDKSNSMDVIPNYGETFPVLNPKLSIEVKEIVYSGKFFKLQDPKFEFFTWILKNEKDLENQKVKFVFFDIDFINLLPKELKRLTETKVFEVRNRVSLLEFRKLAQNFYGFLYFDYCANPFISSTKAWDLANANLPVFCINMHKGEALEILRLAEKVKFLSTKSVTVADFLVEQSTNPPPLPNNPRLELYQNFLVRNLLNSD